MRGAVPKPMRYAEYRGYWMICAIRAAGRHNEQVFRRYVDDYFVFYRDDQVGKKVFSEISNSLQEYKLHLNEAKTIYAKRPFTTQISLAKDGLKSTVKEIYSNRFDKDGGLRKVYSPYREGVSYR